VSGQSHLAECAPAKPRPCSRPNVKATSQGRRAVRHGRPRCTFTRFRRQTRC
jgi:hypothetical protein